MLFDLDGVLSRKDTMAAVVTRRLRAKPLRVLLIAPALALALAAPPDSAVRPCLNRWIVRAALHGLTRGQYDRLAEQAGATLALSPAAVNARAVRAAREAPGRVVVVTASEHRLARTFLDGIGLHDCELQASTLGGDDRRLRITDHLVGDAKLTRVRDEGIDLSGCHFFTDSASDLPLVRAVAHVTIVNPSRRSRRIIVRRVGTVSVRSW